MPEITLTNIGPLARTTIPIPASGGVTVLRGRNGAGKTIALDAIAATVTGGKAKAPLKDLAARGEVSAFGAKLTVGKSSRRTGELEVALLEGRISIADLVDPQIIDPLRADAARIKALIGLSGASFSADDFTGFPPEALDGIALDGDPITVTATVRQRLNQLALAEEKCAASEEASAKALIQSVESVADLAVLPDPVALNTAMETAIRQQAALQQAAQDATARQAQAESAKAALGDMTTIHLDQELAAVQRQQAFLDRCVAERVDLESKLDSAKEIERQAVAETRLRCNAYDASQKQAALVDQLKTQIAAASAPGPTPDDLSAAQQHIDDARAAISAADSIRRARDTRARAAIHEAEATTHATEAVAARRWAKYTDELLSEQVGTVAGCPLSVVDGRLVIPTPSRGPTFYSELSMGEKWRIAMDIAIATVGKTGLIIIPQEAWEGLDNTNRTAIHTQAREAGVTVLTAECSDDATVTPTVFDLAA